jgi:dCMP deaminase
MKATDKWDWRFWRIAEQVATWSKDPSSHIGAVIVKDRKIMATGFNGFPPGIADDGRLYNREAKYLHVVHAEMNAIIQAGHAARGATLYLSGFHCPPCSNCSKHLIAAGIERIVFRGVDVPERWKDDCNTSWAMLREAGVRVVALES